MKELEIEVIDALEHCIVRIKNNFPDFPDKDIQIAMFRYISGWSDCTQKYGAKTIFQNLQMSLEDYENSFDKGDLEACKCHMTYLKDLVLGE